MIKVTGSQKSPNLLRDVPDIKRGKCQKVVLSIFPVVSVASKGVLPICITFGLKELKAHSQV